MSTTSKKRKRGKNQKIKNQNQKKEDSFGKALAIVVDQERKERTKKLKYIRCSGCRLGVPTKEYISHIHEVCKHCSRIIICDHTEHTLGDLPYWKCCACLLTLCTKCGKKYDHNIIDDDDDEDNEDWGLEFCNKCKKKNAKSVSIISAGWFE